MEMQTMHLKVSNENYLIMIISVIHLEFVSFIPSCSLVSTL